jgi:Cdc6-like AAA superfamily ATPase
MKQQKSSPGNAHAGAFDVKEVTLAIRSVFIKLPHVNFALKRMGELAKHECKAEEPEHLLITGQAGVGKSLVLKKLRESFQLIDHSNCREIPVVYTEVPAACSIKKLAGEMLKSMGSPFWNRGTEADRTHQLLTLMKECKVRLVMLDEVNHLVDRGKSATHYAVGDWIKQLTDKAGISFVLAGTPMARVLLLTNGQIRSRFGEEIAIEPLSLESAQEAMIFKNTLKVFQSLLGTLDCVDLAGQEMLRRIAYACGGRMRSLVDLLVRAVELAAVSKPQSLTMSTLEGAFSQVIYSRSPKERNPFSEAFSGQPLTAPGEPFGPERR